MRHHHPNSTFDSNVVHTKDILELQELFILSVLVHRESVTVILLKMVQTMAACSFLLRVVSIQYYR